MADLLEKDFKTAILKIFKKLKKDVGKKSRKQCMNKMETLVFKEKRFLKI